MSGVSGHPPVEGASAAAQAAAAAVAPGRPIVGLRAVDTGTRGQAWLIAFEGPAFLCLDDAGRPVASRMRACDVAQAALAAEIVEEALDAAALRAMTDAADGLAAAAAGVPPAAVEALSRAADHARALAGWREAPERTEASLIALDAATSLQERAHAAYATFVSLTDPLADRQGDLDADVLAALVAAEEAAAAAGLGASLGAMMGEGMAGIAAAADEIAALHVTPLR